MRWPHLSFADLRRGMSSERQVRHSTLGGVLGGFWGRRDRTHSFTGSSSLMAGVNMSRKMERLGVCGGPVDSYIFFGRWVLLVV